MENGALFETCSIGDDFCSSSYNFEHCKNSVKQWASSSLQSDTKDGHILKDLLFFLHVPRTGGRTYFHCFLKKLYSSSLECPRSYDKLRFDPHKPGCRLLVTHDDYSMMSKLPGEKTSVVTILRDPIERVFSAYEFSIEVAARFLVHPNLTSVIKMSNRVRSKNGGISTLEIWPWKYLVPWMREDLFSRRDVKKRNGPSYAHGNDSYDMEEIVMPLHEYISHPVAMDIVHNGATFQVAGLTNNSNIHEAHELRQCVITHQVLGKYVLEVAKRRLDDMLYVGITEDHKESATMFANVVGAQVISQLLESAVNNDTAEQGPSDSSIDTTDNQDNSSSTTKAKGKNMTVGKLMETYETCISSLRSSQSQRRTASLKRIFPANFTKEARRHIPDALLKEIISLNSLDMELYKYAKGIFQKQHQLMEQKLQDSVTPEKWHVMLTKIDSSWIAVYCFGFTFLVSLICFYKSAKRRISKIKMCFCCIMFSCVKWNLSVDFVSSFPFWKFKYTNNFFS
uniref:protein-tyrosine sulfotransferase-like isoform X2 n=1 Tax=Erigeron canadensis TaxID=72917 RepID=UPI001CB9184A|nr:protein-tyrosine sulfotransferase-like isoform X2 [Erigeron canadensis]